VCSYLPLAQVHCPRFQKGFALRCALICLSINAHYFSPCDVLSSLFRLRSALPPQLRKLCSLRASFAALGLLFDVFSALSSHDRMLPKRCFEMCSYLPPQKVLPSNLDASCAALCSDLPRQRALLSPNCEMFCSLSASSLRLVGLHSVLLYSSTSAQVYSLTTECCPCCASRCALICPSEKVLPSLKRRFALRCALICFSTQSPRFSLCGQLSRFAALCSASSTSSALCSTLSARVSLRFGLLFELQLV
jgi:hypothetical protein